MIIINEYATSRVNLGGRGGAENKIKRVFRGMTRVNAELFDATLKDGTRLEFKKQRDLQWFDAGKYHNLSSEDGDILMTFILTTKKSKTKKIKSGLIETIFTIPLKDFLDILTTTEAHQIHGWEWSNIETCYSQKKKYKTQQAKIKVGVRKFLENNREKVDVLWTR